MSADFTRPVVRKRPPSASESLGLRALLRVLAAVLDRVRGIPRWKPAAPSFAVCPPRRGIPVLVEEADGELRCSACGDCERVCPTSCIRMTPRRVTGAERRPGPRTFELDVGRCIFCALCEEVCPESALVLSPHIQLADYVREGLTYGVSELRVPSELLVEPLARLAARSGSEPPS